MTTSAAKQKQDMRQSIIFNTERIYVSFILSKTKTTKRYIDTENV